MTLDHWNNVIIMFLGYKTMGFDISLGKMMNSKFSGSHLGSHFGLQLTGSYLESSPKFFFKPPTGSHHGSKVKFRGRIFAHRTPLSSRTTQLKLHPSSISQWSISSTKYGVALAWVMRDLHSRLIPLHQLKRTITRSFPSSIDSLAKILDQLSIS